MKAQKFTLSLIALSVASSFAAHAAIYDVVEADTTLLSSASPQIVLGTDYESTFGVAIASGSGNCFSTSCTSSSYDMAVETRIQGTQAGQPVDGFGYRDEALFAMDNAFVYAQTQSDFDSYCNAQLLYTDTICDSWSAAFWTEWYRELNGDSTVNSYAYVENGSLISSTDNVVINDLVGSTPTAVGIDYTTGSSSARRSGTSFSSVTAPTVTDGGTRAYVDTGTYTAGSITRNYSGTYYYSSKPALWISASEYVELPWESGVSEYESGSDRLAQGAIKGLAVVSDVIYGVGYNTWDGDENYLNATVFSVDISSDSNAYQSEGNWSSKKVSNAQVEISGDYTYSNTTFTAVNDNLVAIGEAKLAGSNPQNGAAANRLFVVDDISASSLSATFFSDSVGFSGAGGHANAINNYNEIVGQIDVEQTRENGGKPRAKRGFIYPYDGTGTDSSRRTDVFNNKAWLLDDLTNDGSTTVGGNNDYRILSANDINDAGVIAATAFKCSTGYETTEYDADCSGSESVVAVKLVPIAGTTSSNIVSRSYKSTAVERQGAGSGIFVLLGLALTAFSRKKSLFFVKSGR